MVDFKVKDFEQLTSNDVYALLQLRSEVFVVEQDCVYQDIDEKDQKALHVLGYNNNSIVAYARIFKPGDYFKEASIGRVVVSSKYRNKKIGYELMEVAMSLVSIHFKTYSIRISAQTYLKSFYKNLGFKAVGEEYLEDGIPHVNMLYA